MGAGQAKARIAPTAPRLSDGSSWWAEPTMIWKPTSFCRVFNFPTTVTAEDEGFVPLPSPSPTGGGLPPSTSSPRPTPPDTPAHSLHLLTHPPPPGTSQP